MRRRSGPNALLLYLLLNVIVSAATILGVLVIWERVRENQRPPQIPTSVSASAGLATSAPQAKPTQTPVPSGEPLIQIAGIVGATDPQQEFVLLKRLGEGDLSLAGWTLKDEDGNVFTFPSSPELILYKGGAVQVNTRVGSDTPTEVFWNRAEPVWRPGEWATLLDAQGIVRATYQTP
jgi:hypothetical protein